MGVRHESEERQWSADADRGFSGMDGARDGRLLEAGRVQDALNMDFGDGAARTREGIMGVAWGRGLAAPFPWRFLARWPRVEDGTETEEAGIAFGTAAGLGTVAGAGIYSDPFGAEAVLVAAGDRVWRLAAGAVPQTISIPAAMPAACALVQAFDKVILLGGEGFAPLVWDPRQTMDAGLGAFGEVARVASANPYAEPMPEGHYAVEMGGRLWMAYGRDRIAVSEVYDYTNYDPVWGAFRLNEGSDDQIVALAPYREGTLAVLFDQSVWMIAGATGDLSQMRAAPVTDAYGCVGPEAFARVGSDLWMLSHDGVRRMRMGDDGSARGEDAPVSDAVAPLLGRVNWGAASRAQMSVHGRRVYLAVPLDGSSVPDGLLVYDLDRQAWQGLWTSAAADFARLLVAEHGGQRRQMAVTSGGVACVVGEGQADNLLGADAPIGSRVLTRMYAGQGGQRLESCVVDADLATWGEPTVAVRVLGDGPGEISEPSGAAAPSRERWVHWARAGVTRDQSNAARDHAEAGREDYSVALPAVLEGCILGENVKVASPNLASLMSYPNMPTTLDLWGFTPEVIDALVAAGVPHFPTSGNTGWSVVGWGWDLPALDGVPMKVMCIYTDAIGNRGVVLWRPALCPASGSFYMYVTRTGPVQAHAPWHGMGCELHLEARRQMRLRVARPGAGVAVEVSAAGGAAALMGVSVAARPGAKDYRTTW